MKWKIERIVERGNKVLEELGILEGRNKRLSTCLKTKASYILSYRPDEDINNDIQAYLSLTQKDGRCEYSIRIIKERYLPKYQTKTKTYVL